MINGTKPVRKMEFDLLEYWRIVWKRKWIILSSMAILAALAGVYSFTTTPLFQATTTLLVEEPSSNRLTIEDILNSASGMEGSIQKYFNTQLKILRSRSLAERVAKRMGLGRRPEFKSKQQGKSSLVLLVKGFLKMGWLFPKKEAATSGPLATPMFDVDLVYASYVLGGLDVQYVQETNLIDLGFRSPYPQLATDIVNTLADEFIGFSIETRYEATQQTKDFLDEQIARLREDLATKSREMQKYTEEKKILKLSDNENNVVAKFSDIQKAANEARVNRINAEVNYRELNSLRIDSLPEVITNATVQNLKTNYLNLKSEYEEKIRTIYKPEHPEMVQMRTKLDTLRTQLEQEIRKAMDSAESEFRTVKDKEDRLEKELETQRSDITKMNNDAILFKSLESDVQSIQTLLNALISKQNETQVSARISGFRTSNIKILDRAMVPQRPVSPNHKRNLMIGVLLGMFLGVGLAFLSDFLDNTIKVPEDLERLTDLPSLGIIPHFSPSGVKEKGYYYSAYSYRYRSRYGPKVENKPGEVAKATEVELINLLFPKISIAEDYRAVRTAILFSQTEPSSKIITFTSTSPQEGKSATISNLAVSFAQLGEKVLVIDADLRKPRLHKIFKIRNRAGLSDFLTGRAAFEEIVQKTAAEHLSLIPSGVHPPNPAELLNSKKMRELLGLVREKYATILIDTPPVLAVIDPVIVSSLADMTVLVLKMGSTSRKPFLMAIAELRKAKAEIIGVILNDAKIRRNGHGLNSLSFQYEYYQDKSVEEDSMEKAARRHA